MGFPMDSCCLGQRPSWAVLNPLCQHMAAFTMSKSIVLQLYAGPQNITLWMIHWDTVGQ